MNELLEKDNEIYRILLIENLDDFLVINCSKAYMPYWTKAVYFDGTSKVDEDYLRNKLNINLPDMASMDPSLRKQMIKVYNSISPIVPVVGDIPLRNKMIEVCSNRYKVTKSTIRNRLCEYLIANDISIFYKTNTKERELTDDEKNFRWALNKYFYNSLKLSLKETYRRLIRNKYLDSNGLIEENHPSFRQFQYYYQKTVKKENLIISREGKGNFMRDHRALLGNGIREFCTSVGYGLLDSTICDIYLVDESGNLVGRPVLTSCVDGYSGLCLGYSLGYEGGTKSLIKLMNNVISDKVDLCKKYGFEIADDDWKTVGIPTKLITDRGKEYIGKNFSQITDLGVEIIKYF